MSDNLADMMGFTREVEASGDNGLLTLYLLVEPNNDFNSRFRAWDTDMQEWVMVNGWSFDFTDL